MSAYFLDLEGLLSRVEAAATYYQVLGVERADGQERIRIAFQHMLNLLFPPYLVGKCLPAEIESRIERAFQKGSHAFAVLASFAKRREYDSALVSLSSSPTLRASRTVRTVGNPHNRPHRPGSSEAVAEADHLNLRNVPQRNAVYKESKSTKASDNRRRCERFRLSVPARVTGHDRRSGKWHEMAETIDVNRTGLRLRMRKRVKPGTVLYLTLPLPAKLRSHGFAEQTYNVYTLIRRVDPPRQGIRVVGVEFIGENPPAGFLDKPWALFRTRKWGGSERRRPQRLGQIERVRIEYFDEDMRLLSQEEAMTENVGRFGLRISGTMAPAEFDLVMVSCPSLRFESMATLRGRYMGKDGFERICVQLNKEWPSRG